ncbi:MAG: hypothetical protein ACI9W2_000253 [Gammaproteobacteria bacterium]|jgi:uncharacterized protein YcgI (DUF1989 family)
MSRTSVPVPADADERRAAPPIVCYAVDKVPAFEHQLYDDARQTMSLIKQLQVPPREGRCFEVPAGHFSGSFR